MIRTILTYLTETIASVLQFIGKRLSKRYDNNPKVWNAAIVIFLVFFVPAVFYYVLWKVITYGIGFLFSAVITLLIFIAQLLG